MVQYFVLANSYTMFLYFIYKFILANKSNFVWSRYFLVLSVIMGLILPLLAFDTSMWVSHFANESLPKELTLPVLYLQQKSSVEPEHLDLLWLTYLLLNFILLFRLLLQYRKVNSFVKRQNISLINGYKVATETGIGPGTFGTIIVFPRALPDNEIVKHEMAHVTLKHYIDKLFLSILECVFFPVIVLRFIKKDLNLVHEFQADEYACQTKENYIKLLLSEHFSTRYFSLMHTFFHHPLKQRIKMLQQSKPLATSNKFLLTTVFCVSVGFVIITQSIVPMKAIAQSKPRNTDTVYQTAEVNPEFPGGEQALYQYLADNIKYPKGDSSAVTVRVRFVVSKTGKIIEPKIGRKNKEKFDQEVLRVIGLMPNWNPGKDKMGNPVNTYFLLPVNFRPS